MIENNFKKFVRFCRKLSRIQGREILSMSKSKEIRLLNDRLDYYTMEVEDDQFDAEEVIRILKRLDELEPLPEPDMSAEESLEAFWEYVKEREREEKIIAGR